jgi:hypothetical protein
VKCPGQDTRRWKKDDIFEVRCPFCDSAIEFFKDDPKRRCKKCGKQVLNPRVQSGCAEWCNSAEQCVGPERSRNLKARK